MYSKALNNSLLSRLVPRTHARTHTHESDPQWSSLRPPARMERRTEDQDLPRTCPPRVVFELTSDPDQRSEAVCRTRRQRDTSDPCDGQRRTRPEMRTRQTGRALDRLDAHSTDWTRTRQTGRKRAMQSALKTRLYALRAH